MKVFRNEAKRKKFSDERKSWRMAFETRQRLAKGYMSEDDEQVGLLIDAATPVVTIYGKTSMLHVKEVLRTTPVENLAMIADTVRFLKSHGKYVVYDAEHAFDGFKLDPKYAIATWKAAEEAGADIIVLCDTNGGSLPGEIATITKVARENLRGPLGMHTHDDIGLGVANALAGLEVGAMHVQGTINGYGERTGNCNLTSVIPNVAFKMNKRLCAGTVVAVQLKELSQFVDEIANLRVTARASHGLVRQRFRIRGRTHVNAVQKLVSSYAEAY